MTKKQHRQGSKGPSVNVKSSRQTAAKQAAKKRSKGSSRISRDQAADVTAQINSQFAQVQTVYAPQCQSAQTRSLASAPKPEEPSVQELAHVMMSL